MANIFKIHPSIGVARLGDSTTEFCLAPEISTELPVDCDSQGRALLDNDGNEQPIDMFKDSQGRIKRQAARFRVYLYDDEHDTIGRELKIGDKVKFTSSQTPELSFGVVIDIEWTVYLANKKASWYQFQEWDGGTERVTSQLLRNPSITDATARQRLIIDPGPQTVSYIHLTPRRAEFAKDRNPSFSQSFPTALTPNNIETLGEIIVHQQNEHNRLIVLGGHGRSGSFKSGFGEARIETFTNNDGWFDDISDGPVTANLWVRPLTADGNLQPDTEPFKLAVDDPAWVLVAYPGHVPEIENMITFGDIADDVAVRSMHSNPEIYNEGWNQAFMPYFYRDIWPILNRPNVAQWMEAFALASGENLELDAISTPPNGLQDAHAVQRHNIYAALRKPGQGSLFRATIKSNYNYQSPLIPFLSGDNALEGTNRPKFLHLTDTQWFFLQQWADGKFINEKLTGPEPNSSQPVSGTNLDRNVLSNVLGGAFCPGSEPQWIIGNPAIYVGPYRLKHAPYTPGSLSQPASVYGADTSSDLRLGLEPGDLTKYGALPWQADFNECASQDIDVTYEGWSGPHPQNSIAPALSQAERGVFWWPAHRPMEVFLPIGTQLPLMRASIQADVDQFQATKAWATLGFIHTFEISEPSAFADAENDDGGDNLSSMLGA